MFLGLPDSYSLCCYLITRSETKDSNSKQTSRSFNSFAFPTSTNSYTLREFLLSLSFHSSTQFLKVLLEAFSHTISEATMDICARNPLQSDLSQNDLSRNDHSQNNPSANCPASLQAQLITPGQIEPLRDFITTSVLATNDDAPVYELEATVSGNNSRHNRSIVKAIDTFASPDIDLERGAHRGGSGVGVATACVMCGSKTLTLITLILFLFGAASFMIACGFGACVVLGLLIRLLMFIWYNLLPTLLGFFLSLVGCVPRILLWCMEPALDFVFGKTEIVAAAFGPMR
ncbi:hypothetical protein K432DRAFT_377671 [Lepidopterella palustris CBS 459.81]|uniref:Uncharacterized protein n=1 Tax=Lepidopterella palustris CBS 459.81 TaxID=1314670 RepID=A0A8E2EKF2_9PEZI|nr:hypothetical protein K432DRAFT_377671 [Lepidopterella palustris CBS 459.81]